MPVIWKQPSEGVNTYFAHWDGAVFGYVTHTAWPDLPWRIAIFPHGKDDDRTFGTRVETEALARKFVERWARYNHHRIVLPKVRVWMPHEGGNSTS